MEMRIEVELTKLTPGGWDKALMMMFLSYGPKRYYKEVSDLTC